MRSNNLLSHEWCELIFEGRNKEYGAYVLRRTAGGRYRKAMIILGVFLFVVLLVHAFLAIYVGNTIKAALDDLNNITHLERPKPIDGHEFKDISQGRRPQKNMSPGASTATPIVTDARSITLDFGKDGPQSFLNDEIDYVLPDLDTLHNRDRLDLPEEGVQLTPVQVVEEMPQFPGGVGALMKWLDEHIVYPPVCVREKVEGDVEITFLVDKEGVVREPKVSKSLHHRLDNIALTAVKIMPKWTPGRTNGRVAIVQITLPIHFEVD